MKNVFGAPTGTSSYLSDEQHEPCSIKVFPLQDWIPAAAPIQALISCMLK